MSCAASSGSVGALLVGIKFVLECFCCLGSFRQTLGARTKHPHRFTKTLVPFASLHRRRKRKMLIVQPLLFFEVEEGRLFDKKWGSREKICRV